MSSPSTRMYLVIDQYGNIHGQSSDLDGLTSFVINANRHHRVSLGPVMFFEGVGTGSVISFVNGFGNAVPITHHDYNGNTIRKIGFIWLQNQPLAKAYTISISTVRTPTQDIDEEPQEPPFVGIQRQHAVYTWAY